MNMKIFAILLVGVIFASGCVQQSKSCSQDSDCACGTHVTTGGCFYGNKAYVNESRRCPDFCGGIAGNLKISCINAECKQISA